ncbi:MAG: Xaa-Pro peptidase family protein [Maricaulaceae bacterium]|jgi:Xaa-Pro dipeptidase
MTLATLAVAGCAAPHLGATSSAQDLPLTDITTGAAPISASEREARREKARDLLVEHDMAALLIEPGPAMVYFAGLGWGRSERLTAVVIPVRGAPFVVAPYFEEATIRERLSDFNDVRTWHEHESPYARIVEALADRGVTSGRIGVEESVRFFVVDGLSAEDPRFTCVSGAPIARGCRMYKSPAELALMQAANDVTLEAYRHVHARVEPGMAPADISDMMNAATRALGGTPLFSLALLNEASAYPHGSDQPQTVREGGVVLMDCGCAVHGYQSDISRTWVIGEPSAEQRRVWNTVKRGQELALETAQVGVPTGAVDDAVRAFYAQEGWGPDYKAPGLTHRLGHGIGLEGHEPVNFVRGETTPLAPGMCLSNEPGIYLPGAFGVRLEDCLYMTEDGPRLFSGLAPSIDDPIG